MDDIQNQLGKILIYQNEKGDTKIDVYFEKGEIWLSQKAIASLYQVSKSTISEHIKNIYVDEELEKNSTVRKFRTVQLEGIREVSTNIEHYNLEEKIINI